MKKLPFLFLFLLFAGTSAFGQAPVKGYIDPGAGLSNINYEEAKVGKYELPPLLIMPDGKPVISVRRWTKTQRPAILELFKDNVYGKFPGKLDGQHFKVTSVNKNALNGTAICKQITVFFTKDAAGPQMDLLLYLPKQTSGPVPVFAGLNFHGNQGVHTDAGIKITDRWVRNVKNEAGTIINNQATATSRGVTATRWAIETIIARGYGVLTAYCGDLEPDYSEGWQKGIRSQLQKELGTSPSDWGGIGAWAWGLSRMMDYCEADPAINEKAVLLIGHSRLGKAALWAAVNDTRFAAVISNNSGEGGAALARRWYGETVGQINKTFPHWFSPAYKKYNEDPALLTVDQHMLLAMVAPRPLYVASAENDPWADPKGEFLSAKLAEPAYQLYQKAGLGVNEQPPVNQPVGNNIHYHIRTGNHGITDYDWLQYLDFADKFFSKK